MSEPRAPLKGLLVVDCSRMLPGAVLARGLLDLGARLIKIEDARGDLMRHTPPLIDGVGVSQWAELEITDNRIGMDSWGHVERVGDEGVDIETITGHGSVLIGWNSIYAYGTGIQVDGPVTTVSQNLHFGYSPGSFGVAIVGNHAIDARYGHGIQFAGEVNGPAHQTVNILIAENNDGIRAGRDGITFDDVLLAFTTFIDEHAELARILLRELLADDGPGRAIVVDRVAPILDLVERFIRIEGRGVIRPELPVRAALLQVASSIVLRAASGELAGPLWGDEDHAAALARTLFFPTETDDPSPTNPPSEEPSHGSA